MKRFPAPHPPLRSLTAMACIGLLLSPAAPLPADTPHAPKAPALSAHVPDAMILHALNRFTFGPRPGDLETVRAMGLDRWFEQQLHPGAIDQANLNARLTAFPAMQWSSEDLLRRLPGNAIIRQAIQGRIAVPETPVLHAVYQNAIYRAGEKKQKLQNADSTAAPNPATTPAAEPGAGTNSRLSDPGSVADNAVDPALVDEILALPPQDRLARLIAMQPAEADAFFKALRPPQRTALTAGMPPELAETVGALENPERTVVEELIAQRLARDIYSNAQLQEVMTDFWFNHFNVFLRKNAAMPYYLVSYERDVIRPHALGNFEDLLESVAHSPAMLIYLDNATSTGPDSPAAIRAGRNLARNPHAKTNREGLNENYARELMELHTLGVNGGYTQADVIQVARILTGWSVDRPQRGGGFRFDPNRHQPGSKKVMGQKFKDGGEREGRELLHFLATRPATARFLSRKLAVRFVSDDPPSTLVDRMARSYMSSGGDISAVLQTMLHSPEFWSPDVYHAKFKTPLEYVVSAARAGNADVENFRPLIRALREMGMPVYEAVPPTGYKWESSAWISAGALVDRMNFALSLAANRLPGITTRFADPSPSSTPQSEESRLESLLIGTEASDATRTAVLRQFESQSAGHDGSQPMPATISGRQNHNPAPHQEQLLAGLLLGSPEFQRR